MEFSVCTTREDPVLWFIELRRALPVQEYVSERWIEGYACPRVFGLHVAYDRVDDAPTHQKRKVIPDHVAPLEREELATSESRGEIEDHHRAIGIVEFLNQVLELRDGENLRLLRALAPSPHPHQLHGILADDEEFPTHSAIEEYA